MLSAYTPRWTHSLPSANPSTVTPNQIEVTVPANLSAGVNTVQVVHSLNFGTAHEPHRGFQSNSVAFIRYVAFGNVGTQRPSRSVVLKPT